MSKMKTQLIALALRPITSLKPITRNKTRWSSTFQMVERYFRFKQDEVFRLLCEDVDDFEDYLLTVAEDRRLQALQKSLQDLYLITQKLQDPQLTFAQVRVLFDTVMAEYPTLNQYISTESGIVHSHNFEQALQKISARQEHSLTLQEKSSVLKLKSLSPTEEIEVEVDPNVDQTILQKAQARMRLSYVKGVTVIKRD
jgi:hypothetical protein